MKYQFFTIPVVDCDVLTDELNLYLKQHKIIGIDRQFVADGQFSFWSICVISEESQGKKEGTRRNEKDYREILDVDTFARFDALRKLRKRLAEEQNVPVYAIFTNDQLASFARLSSPTLESLRAVDGVGSKRLDRYAASFIAELRKYEGSENAQ